MTIKVLIVDDHAVVRQGLRVLLESQPHIEVIGEADNGEQAVEIAWKLKPDVILMDLLMPGMTGIEAIQRLQALKVPGKVLVLTSSLEDQLVKQALRAGAKGYLLKAIRSSELVQSIERVAEGGSALDPAATQVLIQQVSHNDPLKTLTARELEIFNEAALGWNNPEIAGRLKISEATVRTHMASVLDKLVLRDRTQITIYALKRGLIHLEDLP
jgi:NarL family two-component system response regulator LiaR